LECHSIAQQLESPVAMVTNEFLAIVGPDDLGLLFPYVVTKRIASGRRFRSSI
jgi:hypothetical protein